MKNEATEEDEVRLSEMRAGIDKVFTEILYIQAQERLTTKKARWYEIVLFSGFAAALLAAGKYLL